MAVTQNLKVKESMLNLGIGKVVASADGLESNAESNAPTENLLALTNVLGSKSGGQERKVVSVV